MQNCIKHARPQVIDISIRKAAQELILIIADDGSGFDKAGMSSIGMGIRNMQHRTNLLGGDIRWEVTTAGGTAVLITLPLE